MVKFQIQFRYIQVAKFSSVSVQQSTNTPFVYSGGLEILFGNQNTVNVDVSPPKEQTEVFFNAQPAC